MSGGPAVDTAAGKDDPVEPPKANRTHAKSSGSAIPAALGSLGVVVVAATALVVAPPSVFAGLRIAALSGPTVRPLRGRPQPGVGGDEGMAGPVLRPLRR
jgi:hypothetical protein